MTKDVLLKISGLHADVDSDEPVELITAADYFMKNDKHYIVYTEPAAEGMEEVKNTIKISKNRIDVIKHGGQDTHMVFEPYKKNVSCYNTPVGNLVIGVHTLNIELNEQEHSIAAKIDYALEINDQHVSDCAISMDIRSKSHAQLKL